MSGTMDVPAVAIQPTDYGKFFVRDVDGRVWRGDSWVTFGPAEIYATYLDAMKARRAAIAAATGETK